MHWTINVLLEALYMKNPTHTPVENRRGGQRWNRPEGHDIVAGLG